MDPDFDGKVALVTGAGSGIGRDLVRKLASLGANVIAVSQTLDKLESLKEELCGNLRIVAVNLGNWKETEEKLAVICGEVDYLVNNAGFAQDQSVDEVSLNNLDKTLDINLKSPINLIRLVSKGMKERRFGVIVNVSSVASIAALDDHTTYASSKAALDMVTKISAKELGKYNVRVNSVNPTVVWTQMGRKGWSDPDKKAAMIAKIPLGRFAEVQEVVGPIVFLLSSKASMISGAMLPIDGGFVAT